MHVSRNTKLSYIYSNCYLYEMIPTLWNVHFQNSKYAFLYLFIMHAIFKSRLRYKLYELLYFYTFFENWMQIDKHIN